MTRKRFKKLLIGKLNYSRDAAEEESRSNITSYRDSYSKLINEYESKNEIIRKYVIKYINACFIPINYSIHKNTTIASIEAEKLAYKKYIESINHIKE